MYAHPFSSKGKVVNHEVGIRICKHEQTHKVEHSMMTAKVCGLIDLNWCLIGALLLITPGWLTGFFKTFATCCAYIRVKLQCSQIQHINQLVLYHLSGVWNSWKKHFAVCIYSKGGMMTRINLVPGLTWLAGLDTIEEYFKTGLTSSSIELLHALKHKHTWAYCNVPHTLPKPTRSELCICSHGTCNCWVRA